MYATSSGTGYGSFYTTPRGGGGDTDRAAGMSTPGRSRSAPRVRAPPQPAVVQPADQPGIARPPKSEWLIRMPVSST